MSRRRVYSNPPAAELVLSAVLPYVFGAVALWYINRKAKSELPKKYEEVKVAAAQIKTGLPGFLADKLMGRNASGYITTDEQNRRAQALLEYNRAKAAVSGFAPVVYGS